MARVPHEAGWEVLEDKGTGSTALSGAAKELGGSESLLLACLPHRRCCVLSSV